MHEILRLLDHMSNKELVEGSSQIQSLSGESVLMGLFHLVPHMNETLLSYPDLCTKFFEVIAVCLSAFVSKFATMTRQTQLVLTKSLQFSLGHASPDIVMYGLEIIQTMANHHVKNS